MHNLAMARKLEIGDTVDVADAPRTRDGDYVLDHFDDLADYCDSRREAWIWSIGRHHVTGHILASTSTKFYRNPQYECLFLR